MNNVPWMIPLTLRANDTGNAANAEISTIHTSMPSHPRRIFNSTRPE